MPQISKDDSTTLEAEIARRLSGFENVRKSRASVMQIFSNAGQDEAEKIRGEAERFLGPDAKVPSQYPWCHRYFAFMLLTETNCVFLANQAEFLEFNFGYDVVKESEALLMHL